MLPGVVVATHILLDVLLPLSECRLAKLRCELRRRVVYEVAVLPKHIGPRRLCMGLLLLLLLVRTAIVAAVGL